MVNDPLTKFMFLFRPSEGGGLRWCSPSEKKSAGNSWRADVRPEGRRDGAAGRRGRSKYFAPAIEIDRGAFDHTMVCEQGRHSKWPAIGPHDNRCRSTAGTLSSGAEIMHMAEKRLFAPMASQEAWLAEGPFAARRHGCLSTRMGVASPAASPSARRVCVKSTRNVRAVGAAAGGGPRQVTRKTFGPRTVTSTGHPASRPS